MPFDNAIIALGPTNSPRLPTVWSAAFSGWAELSPAINPMQQAHLSVYTFDGNICKHMVQMNSTAGFDGPCGAHYVPFDFDKNNNPDDALIDARKFCLRLRELGVSDDEPMVFFSGKKGFHALVPTFLWAPEPGINFAQISRIFAERIAELAGVSIDTMIYQKLHLLRMPNTRHPDTGLFKRHLTVDELLNLDVPKIKNLAKVPIDFHVPRPVRQVEALKQLWADARAASADRGRRVPAPNGKKLFPTTLQFIRFGAPEGERNKELYKAACNLCECRCPPALVESLLTEPALDSGLPPREVETTIASAVRKFTNEESSHDLHA